jgi:hypothetical protein
MISPENRDSIASATASPWRYACPDFPITVPSRRLPEQNRMPGYRVKLPGVPGLPQERFVGL